MALLLPMLDATPLPARPRPVVSVVIPTIDRRSLDAAVTSVMAQSTPPAEILVVHDAPAGSTNGLRTPSPHLRRAGAGVVEVRHLHTSGGTGPAAARMTGVRAARGDLIAFLDDDDAWEPVKLEEQLTHVPAGTDDGRETVVLTGATWVDTEGRTTRQTTSTRRHGSRIDEALFLRPRFWHDDRIYGGSVSLLCPRRLFERHPLDPDLRLFEDWDWLLRVGDDPRVDVVVVPESLVRCRGGVSPSSTSATRGVWWEGVSFVEQRVRDPRVRGDFLLVESASAALDHGERRAAATIAWRSVRTARPHLAAVMVFLANACLPRSVRRRGARSVTAVARLVGDRVR